MPSNSTYVCIPCRSANRHGGRCARCGQDMGRVYYRWRVPKRRNERAWQQIEAGDWRTEPPSAQGGPQPGYRVRFWEPLPEPTPRPAGCEEVARQIVAGLGTARDVRAAVMHPDVNVRGCLIECEDLPREAVEILSTDTRAGIRRTAASHPNLDVTGATALRLSRDADPWVRAEIAARIGVVPAVLRRAARDPELRVVAAAASNPALPERQLRTVPVGVVPMTRLRELLTRHLPAELQDPAAALLESIRAANPDITARHALAVVTAALAP